VKPFTLYRCADGGGSYGHRSLWTGAYWKPAPDDDSCFCGAEMVEDRDTRSRIAYAWSTKPPPDPMPHGIAAMTPEQLAEAGIPATVALQARLEEWQRRERECSSEVGGLLFLAAWNAYRDALAILEAKGQ
jgi:hypothetical protein